MRYYVSHTSGFVNEWIFEHEYAVVDSVSTNTVALFYATSHRIRTPAHVLEADRKQAQRRARACARSLNVEELTWELAGAP